LCDNVYAQQVTLQGIVVDQMEEPIEFVYVSLLKDNMLSADIVMTDSIGRFSISTERGNYILKLEQFGQELLEKEIILNQNTGLQFFKVDQFIALEGIIVTHKKKLVERKVDRVVFNVEKTISTIGGDAMDVLKVTPTSKYRAEGNSGLVNIVLKESKNDYWGVGIRSTYQRTLKDKGYFGGDFTYQKNKLSLFTSLTIGKGSSDRTENMKVFYPSQLWELRSDQEVYTKLISTKISGDYDVSKNTTIGIQYLGNVNRPDFEETIWTNIYSTLDQSDSIIVTNGYTDAKQFYHSVNGHLKTKLDSLGKTLSINRHYIQ
jgi:hypothetical protein